ncbi:unnamed protein product [Onchocerca flexuosa]|uniref:Hypotheticial protein n=1 Tax=Onchocerca flexuosa TaxID=387005 RepID=A0A183HR77_9BILA|nr:unnamed protein product [Onchocerca flexuosa]
MKDMEVAVEVVMAIVMVVDVVAVLVAVDEVVLMIEEAMVIEETGEDLLVVEDSATEEDVEVAGVDMAGRVMNMEEMVVEEEEVAVVVIEAVEVVTEEVVEEDEARGLEVIQSHDPTTGHAMAVVTLISVSGKNVIDVMLLDLVVAIAALDRCEVVADEDAAIDQLLTD